MADFSKSAALLPGAPELNRQFPNYPQGFVRPNVLWFEKSDDELTSLYPVPNTARSLSRSALLLSAISRQAKQYLDEYIQADPYSVGIYCAVEQGPIGFASVQKLQALRGNFSQNFKKNFPPKQYLKHLPMIAAACPGIFLGIKGPIQVFNHSAYAAHHALDQAKSDLSLNRIKAAQLVHGGV